MPLKIANKDIAKFTCCGGERNVATIGGKKCFGKRYSITESSSTGTGFSISRISSSNQHAETGSIGSGNTIYYGDVITISVFAKSNYTDPKLYVNIGDGSGTALRTTSFTFTVLGNVSYKGTATEVNPWQTVWTGSRTFTSSGSFSVPGLAAGGSVQVSANAVFSQQIMDYSDNTEYTETINQSMNRTKLPATLWGYVASIELSRNSDQVFFIFKDSEEYSKAYAIYEVPTSITITEVRRQS